MLKKFDTVGDLLSGLNLTLGDKIMYHCKTGNSSAITAIISAAYPAKKCIALGPTCYSLDELFDDYEIYDTKHQEWVPFGYDEEEEKETTFRSNQDYYMQRDGKVEENLFFHVDSLVEIDGEDYVRFLGKEYIIQTDVGGEFIQIDSHYSVHACDISDEESALDNDSEEDDSFDHFIDEAIDCLDSICKQLKNH